MSSIPLIFTPVQTEEKRIPTDLQAGWLYFTTDTGKIYLDTESKRVGVGGSGAAVYYGTVENVQQDEETLHYILPITGLEDKTATPKLGDIIINGDGAFYRISEITNENFICNRIAVSGTGEGGGGSMNQIRPTLTYENKLGTSQLINGQDFALYMTINSYMMDNDIPLDNEFTIFWELVDYKTSIAYKRGQIPNVANKTETKIEFGNALRESTTTQIVIWASGPSHEYISNKINYIVITSDLYLALPTNFSSLKVYDDPKNISFTCNAYGLDRTAIFYFGDNESSLKEIGRFDLNEGSSSSEITCKLPAELATHGSHLVRIELYQRYPNGKLGLPATPIQFEIAVKDGISELPIIWLGEYQEKYYSYDSIIIPYAIYNPTSSSTDIILKKDNIQIGAHEDKSNTTNSFYKWEIANATIDQMNYYQICCGDEGSDTYVQREISFKVETDTTRTVEPVSGYALSFDAKGRSNDESAVERKTWKQILDGKEISASFEGFNWRNNGWLMDETLNTTFLRVSNGAKFSLPLGKMTFAGSTQNEQSHTIEMQLKISNSQSYSNLVTNITRYDIPKYNKETGEIIYNDKGEPSYERDDTVFGLFEIELAKKTYDNYDKFLLDYFNAINGEIYDLLKFRVVQKNVDITNAVCKYISNNAGSVIGLAIGTQDAFFRNGAETVDVSFVEDDLINLTFIYNDTLKLLQIFINGVISGVISSSIGRFEIDSDLVFDSQHCDIDIYSIRIYNKELNINNIVHNYAVDRKNIEIFDQVNKYQMAKDNRDLGEFQIDFSSIENYNLKNPHNPTMPYIIFDTTKKYKDNKLPWKKGTARDIVVEFVNVPLDMAYENGELEQLAANDGLIPEDDGKKGAEERAAEIRAGVEQYYKHHCPSWISTMVSGDTVSIDVQGTSSEFYPRRNFKIKTKLEDVQVWDDEKKNEDGSLGAFVKDDVLNIYMDKGPFAQKFKNDMAKVKEDDKYYGHEETRLSDGWYMNNYTNATDRWTMKVDYMESSGSYNAGFASMVSTAYSKHPLQDYLELLQNKDKLSPDINIDRSLMDSNKIKWDDYRTSLLGFPVMAFQRRWGADGKEEVIFIGFYRMLLDKGSNEVLGFKPDKKVLHKLFPTVDKEGNPTYKALRDVAECWEFSTNNRGYCSYRDPYKRVKLSFKAPSEKGFAGFVDTTYAPIVTNNFEYRYHSEDDTIDQLLTYKSLTVDEIEDINKSYGTSIPLAQEGDLAGPRAVEELYVDNFSKNWEKACSWVYSTNIADVIAQQTYALADVGEAKYQPGIYFVYQGKDENNNNIYAISNDAFDSENIYYVEDKTEIQVTDPETNITITEYLYPDGYRPVKLVNDDNYVYVANKFYQLNNNAYSLVSDTKFNSNLFYYESKVVEDYQSKADLLVRKANTIEGKVFDSQETYYTYNDQAIVSPGQKTGAVQLVENPIAANFDTYYVEYPVTYLNKTYTHDTQEYRAAKFINELKQHFDPEYLATYFIMTEVFECYDSRGKNCMMASWGPLVENGDYIWYPIFYDIDTQLGINNTGIPSFKYNVDASDQGNFSTNDSILWSNFYSFFKNSYILDKYKQLRNSGTINRKADRWYDIENPTLSSVEDIERWYNFNPETHNNIACRGIRPLIATNLDEYFKYITITNPKAEDQGVAYLEGNSGDYAIDTEGSFFYALQGDRSQSRRQFLTNRLDYTDSWLNQMNYARNGANRIRGRISANNMDHSISSDWWIETDEQPYWKDAEFGEKTHEFDAEYWLSLTPVRSTYVTAGDDSANYASQKFNGTDPVKFKLTELESGIRRSEDYNEQLLYIYGLKTMGDVGDMSKLYWTEFNIEGEAPKLTRLQLGYDGIDEAGNRWYNKKLNAINLKAKMPLLKEANFSNLTILSSNLTLNLNNSPKLENFRAVGSNLTVVHFADGAALNTVYMPDSLTHLVLDNTNMLTKLVAKETAPVPKKENNYTVEQGLYIDGLFSEQASDIKLANISLKNVPLGYQSYTLLKQLYNKTLGKGFKATITNVDWCPYTKLVKGDIYESKYEYYKDNGHYGFEKYTFNDTSEFNAAILNGELYRKDKESKDIVVIDNSFLNMLNDFINPLNVDRYKNYDASSHPEISGIVYIENDTEIDESEVSNVLQKAFPGLTFFFAKVKKAYSAKFVLYDEDTKTYSYVPLANGSSAIPSIQKMTQEEFAEIVAAGGTPRFNSPFELYKPKKDHYDFNGWSNEFKNGTILLSKDEWNNSQDTIIVEGKYDYVYYARFVKHEYEIHFYNNNDPSYGDLIDKDGRRYMLKKVVYGEVLNTNILMPQAIDGTELEERNTFKGWALNKEQGRVYSSAENISKAIIDPARYPAIKNYDLYAVFQSENVYEHPTDMSYFKFDYSKGYPIIHTIPEKGQYLSGKITLPAKDPEGRDIKGVGYMLGSIVNSTIDRPDNIFGNNVTHIFFEKDSSYERIENYAFSMGVDSSIKRSLIGVYLPDSIRIIGNGAFEYQAGMTDIILNDDITKIGDNAFNMGYTGKAGNVKITTLPKSLKTLGTKAFMYNSGITIDSLPDGLATIPESCFERCPNIRIDSFGESEKLILIDKKAFYGAGQNSQIKNVYLYRSVQNLGENCFYNYGSNTGLDHIYAEQPNPDWNAIEICGKAVSIDDWNGVM